MKKVLVVLFAMFAFVSAACGGSDDNASSDDNGSSSNDGTVAKGDPDSDFCDSARKFSKDFNDTGDADTPEEQMQVFKDLRSAIDTLDKEAPDEIEDDVKIVADAFRESDDLLKKYDYDFTKVPEEEAAKISINDPEVTAASDRVESYFEKTCGIDSDGDGDTDGVSDDDSTSTSVEDGTGTDETTETTAEGE
jgi:hypothetical protein